MALKAMIEYTVWVHLDQVKDIELVLLKGHLLLEAVIDNSLDHLIERGSNDELNLTFAKKLRERLVRPS